MTLCLRSSLLLLSLLNLFLIKLLFMLWKEHNKNREFVMWVSCCSNSIFRIPCIVCLIFQIFPFDTLWKIHFACLFLIVYLKINISWSVLKHSTFKERGKLERSFITLPCLDCISLFSKEDFNCKEELSFVTFSVIRKMEVPVHHKHALHKNVKLTKVTWEHVLHIEKYTCPAVKSVIAGAIPQLISN